MVHDTQCLLQVKRRRKKKNSTAALPLAYIICPYLGFRVELENLPVVDACVATCRHEYKYNNGMKMMLAFYFVPVSPGRTKIMGSFLFQMPFKAKPSLKKKIMAKLPLGFKHNMPGNMDDQDAIMLHNQVLPAVLCCAVLCCATVRCLSLHMLRP